MSVAATARLDLARSSSAETCRGLLSGTDVSHDHVPDSLFTASVTLIFPSLSVLISCFFVSNWLDPRRSLIWLQLDWR